MANVGFILCTQADFNTARSGSLVTGTLYFIEDTRNIYRATSATDAIPYTDKVKLVDSFEAANSVAQGTLFLNSTTGEARVSNGSTWITVGSNIQTTATGGTSDAAGKAPLLNASGILDNSLLPTTAGGGTSAESGKIPVLNGAGKLDDSVIPDLALSQYVGMVASCSALKSIAGAKQGDWALIDAGGADNGSYILNSATNGNEAVWVKLVSPLTYTLPAATSGTRGGVTVASSTSGLALNGDSLSVAPYIAGTGLGYSNGVLNVEIGTTVAAFNHTHSTYIEKPVGVEAGYIPAATGSGAVTWIAPTSATSIAWGAL